MSCAYGWLCRWQWHCFTNLTIRQLCAAMRGVAQLTSFADAGLHSRSATALALGLHVSNVRNKSVSHDSLTAISCSLSQLPVTDIQCTNALVCTECDKIWFIQMPVFLGSPVKSGYSNRIMDYRHWQLVLKPSFSQSLSLCSHLFLDQVHILKFDHLVFGSHWQQKCWWVQQIKPAQLAFWTHYYIVILTYSTDNTNAQNLTILMQCRYTQSAWHTYQSLDSRLLASTNSPHMHASPPITSAFWASVPVYQPSTTWKNWQL